MSNIKKLYTVLILGAFLLMPSQINAQEQTYDACGGVNQVSALVATQAETPYIYVKADRPEDAVHAQLYFQPMDGTGVCMRLGSAVLSEATWLPMGRLDTAATQGILVLVLNSADFSQAGASSPLLIFTGETPPCNLSADCRVNYQGVELIQAPRKLSVDSDTIRVGQLLPIENDKVLEVIYSVDNRQVYRSETLQDFDQKYIPGGKHTISRTIILDSGQSLTDSQEFEHSALGQPFYLVTSLYFRYAKLFNIVGLLIGGWLLWLVGFSIAKWLHRRRQWRLNHIAGLRRTPAVTNNQDALDGSAMDVLRNHKILAGGVLGIIIGFFVVYSYVLTVQITDGVSMYPTLEDRSRHPLFILPATIGRVTGGGYVPPRGAIVVVDKTEHNLFNSAIQESSYVVKRVVGLPGDRLVIQNGVISIFNQEYPDGFIPDDEYQWISDLTGSEFFRTDITLKENELFVVGDNRDESIDSRFYGPVQSSQIIGRVL